MAEHVNNVDLSIKQGEDYTSQIHWVTESGEPMRVSGSASMEIREASGTPGVPGDLVATLKDVELGEPDAGDGQITLSTYSGVISIYLPSNFTKAMKVGAHLYDLFCNVQIWDTNADRGTHVSGDYNVRMAVSGICYVRENITQSVPNQRV